DVCYHGTVAVLLNTTAPGATSLSFANQSIFAAGAGADAISVADINGDGKLDLIVGNYVDNNVSVLLNTTLAGAASPSFSDQKTFVAGYKLKSVAVADFNGDGRPDIVANSAGNYYEAVFINTTSPGATTPSFAARQTFPTPRFPTKVIAGDINGD